MAEAVTISFPFPVAQLIGSELADTLNLLAGSNFTNALAGVGLAMISCVIHSQPRPSIRPTTNLVGLVIVVLSGKVYTVPVGIGGVEGEPAGIVVGPANGVKLPEVSLLYILYWVGAPLVTNISKFTILGLQVFATLFPAISACIVTGVVGSVIVRRVLHAVPEPSI